MNPDRELRTIVIDGKLPVAEIAKRMMEATANGCGVAISFDGTQDNDSVKSEINAMFSRINDLMTHDDPGFPNDAHWIIPETDERRYLTLDPAPAKGNRKARRAAAAQRRRKW